VLIEEMDHKDSVSLIEHRYTPKYNQTKTSGIYCVQFMTFKNSFNGIKILNWWREKCNDWCYARFEDGKFGDQKYLDDWTDRFSGVRVLEHLGGGVAPWNVQQYDLSDEKFKLIFYHFHNYKFINKERVDFGSYKLRQKDVDILYRPYTRHLKAIEEKIKLIDGQNDYNGIDYNDIAHWKAILLKLMRRVNGTYNVFNLNQILKD